jgi:uridine kinase
VSQSTFSFANETEKRAFVARCEDEFRARIGAVATAVASRDNLRFLTLAGPTCSGKTTTAAILIDRLAAMGRRVTVISIDDFFYDRDYLYEMAEKTGHAPDLDSVRALDLEALRTVVSDVIAGRPTVLPHFDFAAGKRCLGVTLVPHPEDIYLFEGIQAVYPEVVALFPREALFSLYISVEKEIEDDVGGHWKPNEIRLLRRLLRDSKFRGTDAETTFSHWGSVLWNEQKNIEPHKDGCDCHIDSSLLYELCVLRDPLIALLADVIGGSHYSMNARLLSDKLCDLPSISAEYVPADSVLREFIGGKDIP